MVVAKPPVVSAADWKEARARTNELVQAVAAELDRLTAARKRMPMVRVEGDYRFEGPGGPRCTDREVVDGHAASRVIGGRPLRAEWARRVL